MTVSQERANPVTIKPYKPSQSSNAPGSRSHPTAAECSRNTGKDPVPPVQNCRKACALEPQAKPHTGKQVRQQQREEIKQEEKRQTDRLHKYHLDSAFPGRPDAGKVVKLLIRFLEGHPLRPNTETFMGILGFLFVSLFVFEDSLILEREGSSARAERDGETTSSRRPTEHQPHSRFNLVTLMS